MRLSPLQPLLASACSLLPQPIWAATDEVSYLNGYNVPLEILSATIFGVVLLVATVYHQRRRTRNTGDDINTRVETTVEFIPNELMRLVQETTEQINKTSELLRSTTKTRVNSAQTIRDEFAATEFLPSSGQNNKPANDTAIISIAEPLDKNNNTKTPKNSQPLMTHKNIRDVDLTHLDTKLCELAELTKLLQIERQALPNLSTNNQGASLDTDASKYYLTFNLGDETFAINALSVHRIIDATQLINRSSTPPKIRSVIRLRDTLVPVIDLGSYMGRQPTGIHWSSQIVILKAAENDSLRLICIVVDTADKVLEIPTLDIERVSNPNKNFILGTAKGSNCTITILNIGGLFSTNWQNLTAKQHKTLQ